jgi:hypothetical protein
MTTSDLSPHASARTSGSRSLGYSTVTYGRIGRFLISIVKTKAPANDSTMGSASRGRCTETGWPEAIAARRGCSSRPPVAASSAIVSIAPIGGGRVAAPAG